MDVGEREERAGLEICTSLRGLSAYALQAHPAGKKARIGRRLRKKRTHAWRRAGKALFFSLAALAFIFPLIVPLMAGASAPALPGLADPFPRGNPVSTMEFWKTSYVLTFDGFFAFALVICLVVRRRKI